MRDYHLYLDTRNVNFNSLFGHMLQGDMIYPPQVRMGVMASLAHRLNLTVNKFREDEPDRLDVFGSVENCKLFIQQLYPSVKDFHVTFMPWEQAQDMLVQHIQPLGIAAADFQIVFLRTNAIVALRHKKDAVMIKLSAE